MKNMLVTGGCGFIGTNFIKYLLEESGFKGRVVNVDALTYAGNPLNLTEIEQRFTEHYAFIQTDICNKVDMSRIFIDYEIDTICHFAAESHVDRSIVAPNAFIQTNIFGTFNLLELAREHQNQLELFHHRLQTQQPLFGLKGRFRPSRQGLP